MIFGGRFASSNFSFSGCSWFFFFFFSPPPTSFWGGGVAVLSLSFLFPQLQIHKSFSLHLCSPLPIDLAECGAFYIVIAALW